MTDVSTFLAFVGGVAFGAVIMGVLVGSIAHSNYERYLSMKATAFGIEEQLLDALEGNTERRWLLVAEGADEPEVVSVPMGSGYEAQIATSKLSEGTRIIKIDDMDEEE